MRIAGKTPIRNPAYLRWIRSLACLVCRSRWRIEAAHTGPHGLAQKSSDLSTIPLCARHHRTGSDSYHELGPVKFAQVHGLDIAEIIARLSARSRIRITAGYFVGQVGGEEYELAPIRAGLTTAIRALAEFKRARELGQA